MKLLLFALSLLCTLLLAYPGLLGLVCVLLLHVPLVVRLVAALCGGYYTWCISRL